MPIDLSEINNHSKLLVLIWYSITLDQRRAFMYWAIFECDLVLAIIKNAALSVLPMNGVTLSWVESCLYLQVYVWASNYFKCSFSYAKKSSFYQSFTYETNYRAALQMSACGCTVIDCSWTRVRRSSSGPALQGVVSTYQTVTSMSIRTRSNQFLLPAILLSLWTVRC